jgi:hypothetical protein
MLSFVVPQWLIRRIGQAIVPRAAVDLLHHRGRLIPALRHRPVPRPRPRRQPQRKSYLTGSDDWCDVPQRVMEL